MLQRGQKYLARGLSQLEDKGVLTSKFFVRGLCLQLAGVGVV